MPVDYTKFLDGFPVRDFISFRDGLVLVCENLVRITKECPSIASALNSAVTKSISDLDPGCVDGKLRLICYSAYLLSSSEPKVKAAIENYLMNASGTQEVVALNSLFESVKTKLPSSYILVSEFIRGCLQQQSFHLTDDESDTFVWINNSDDSGQVQRIELNQSSDLGELLASFAKMSWFIMTSFARKVPAEEVKNQFTIWVRTLYSFLSGHGVAAAEQLKAYMNSSSDTPTMADVQRVSGIFHDSVSSLRFLTNSRGPLPEHPADLQGFTF